MVKWISCKTCLEIYFLNLIAFLNMYYEHDLKNRKIYYIFFRFSFDFNPYYSSSTYIQVYYSISLI